MVPYSAKAVANFLLDLAKGSGRPLTPMKLQKLVYYAHGWHLALRGKSLIDEQVEAWAFGPVIPSLYHAFKGFGDQPITRPATDVNWGLDDECDLVVPAIPDDGSVDAMDAKALTKRVWEIYDPFTAIQLSNMTHEAGSPWDRVKHKYNGNIPMGTDIPEEWIRDYFLARIRKST